MYELYIQLLRHLTVLSANAHGLRQPLKRLDYWKKLNIVFLQETDEIVEASIIEGGLKLHNLKRFDAALEIGWLKRYISTKSKWTITPFVNEFDGLFRFGIDYIERLLEMTFNPFWLDVLKSLKNLWTDDKIIIKDNILLTPIWYNDKLRLQVKREWIMICWILMEVY